MQLISNPYRGGEKLVAEAPYPSTDAPKVAALLSRCPKTGATELKAIEGPNGLGVIWAKDERTRMGLGSFKALGAAYVIATHASELSDDPDNTTLKGRTYVTASAGNHGMSVAAGARVFGANAVVCIAETVPESFAERLAALGAKPVRAGATYAESMDAAMKLADDNGWTLLSDSSWSGYTELPHILMEGYLQMVAEAVEQCPDVPSHIFLQAGVGGLAGAVAAYARKAWGDAPTIIVVEPEAAPALQASIEEGKVVFADGPDSIMGRLDCKEPSMIALNGLGRDADYFLTLADDEVEMFLPSLADIGLETSASGGAGIAAALRADVQGAIGLGGESRVLCFISEGPA